jgi:cobyrinic acid a,c-diamide synthase
MAPETLTEDRLGALAECVETHMDLDRLLTLSTRPRAGVPAPAVSSSVRARIGIARDAAFCFYYDDNLRLLRQSGAELVDFSPLVDRALPPDLDGIYFGGGYPELHAEALSANSRMREEVAAFVASNAPVYAECGGFMYLTDAIVDADDRSFPMTGIFPTTARMQARRAKLGYIEVETSGGGGWLPTATRARGHEFRYSAIDPMPASVRRAYQSPADGYWAHSTLGSYIHLHFVSCPLLPRAFVEACKRWHARKI